MEAQVVNVRLLRFNLHYSIIHFLLHSFLLSHQVLLGLESHAGLGHLENDFEEDKEGGHVGSSAWVGNSGEQFSLLLLRVHVHVLRNFLDPLFLESRWVCLLHSLTKRVCRRENGLSLHAVSRSRVPSCKGADEVENLSASGTGRARAVRKDSSDVCEDVFVDLLGESSLVLVHCLQQLVQVAQLLVVLLHLFFLFQHCSVEVVVSILSLVLLGSDLLEKNEMEGE